MPLLVQEFLFVVWCDFLSDCNFKAVDALLVPPTPRTLLLAPFVETFALRLDAT
jgi:hypothetical protein